MKRAILVLALFAATVIPSFAAEALPGSDSADNIQQILDKLRGTPGLYGASGSEMNQFIDMVDTPELSRVVARINQQLLEQGYSESNPPDMATVSALVRQSLTRQDAEAILGTSVSQQDFQQGLQAGGQEQNLDQLIQMLNSK